MCTDLGFNERNFGEMSTDRFEAGYVQEEPGASYRARKKGKCWNTQVNKQTEINHQWWGWMSEKPTEKVRKAGIFLKIK